MAKEKEAPVVPERATQAATRPVTVPLDEFVLKPELYSHRAPEELKDRDRLLPLMDSLTVEGLLNPVEFYRGPDGTPVVTKGHRRINALRQLAQENRPGFTAAMPVEAVEVLNASPQDLLCRSVADNANRKDYTLGERIRAAKTLHDGGVEASRAAFALSYSTKQYLRDLKVAQEDWLLTYVEKEDVGHTAAADLLEAAEGAGRVAELKEHLDQWVAARRQEVQAGGKDKKLKGLLSKALSDHWIGQLREKQPLDDRVARPADFQANIDADANRITVEGKLDLLTAPLPELEKAELALQAMQKVVGRYRAARKAVEGARGPQDVAREEARELELLASEVEPARDVSTPGQGETPADDVRKASEGQ
jgi:hypothetical protein